MNEFVEECRREWRRLGVPDPVANEMAADLTADLQEAEAEGGSAEDVLGNSAFDPRRFAASWAVARGVTSTPPPDRPAPRHPPLAIALTILLGALTVGAGLVLLVGFQSRSFAVVARLIVIGPGPTRLFIPGSNRIQLPGPLGPFGGTQIAGVDNHPLAWVLLIVGVVGLGVLAILYLSPWSGSRRARRDENRGAPGWN